MPKLYFRYGVMNSSKTSNLIMVAHNYRSRGRRVMLVRPSVDSGKQGKIVSRALGDASADVIMRPEDDLANLDCSGIHCILVDEAQFLSERNVEALRRLTPVVPVICYGLRTDYRGRLWPGSKRLMELADTIEEVKTVCTQCDKKATISAKFRRDGDAKVVVRDGSDELDLGKEDKYQAMCWECWIR